MRRAAVAALFWISTAAGAAPFCVVDPFSDRCHYYSARQCESEARAADGECIVNYSDIKRPIGVSRWCLVTAGGASCVHINRPDCLAAAQAQDGLCVVNPERRN